jgi:putative SOS response-associated peptidase YedK
MPSPAFALKGRNSDPGATNVRNVASPHWRRWLGIEHRCVVPFTSFSENETLPNGSKPPVWFALDETRPLAFFAGIWTRWTSVRKLKEGETTNDIFAFLTTEPNEIVGAIHPKAMPAILTTREEIDLWLTAPTEVAFKLQRPLADGALAIVARGGKKDEGASRPDNHARAGYRSRWGLALLAQDDKGRYAFTPESGAFLVSRKQSFMGWIYRHASSQLLPITGASEVAITAT